jgi:hypothetical protein
MKSTPPGGCLVLDHGRAISDLDGHRPRTCSIPAPRIARDERQVRDRQSALGTVLLVVGEREVGVDQVTELAVDVPREDPQADADLGAARPNPPSRIVSGLDEPTTIVSRRSGGVVSTGLEGGWADGHVVSNQVVAGLDSQDLAACRVTQADRVDHADGFCCGVARPVSAFATASAPRARGTPPRTDRRLFSVAD